MTSGKWGKSLQSTFMIMYLARLNKLTFLLIGLTFIVGCKKEENRIPSLETYNLSAVTMTSAESGGLIITDGGSTITERGVCWSTSPLPTVNSEKAPGGSGAGSFVSTISGLTPNTLYYVRAYATNETGTGYGAQLFLKTMYGIVSDVDGNDYQTVMIGNQEWMAENLKVTHYNTMAPIPNVSGYDDWTKLSSGAYSWYDNDYQIYGSAYGALYNFYTVEDPRGLCPVGWHVPSLAEWDTLFAYLGGYPVAGGKLKSSLTALYEHPFWLPPNYLGTNESGFAAFPGGFRSFSGGGYSGLGPSGYWWTTSIDHENVVGIWISTSYAGAFSELHSKNSGLSVRCIKD
ncbi:MAG: fibrobacter succinogenes major paralogous domain-containing protein [Bacteroidales bacterium]|nr:fibrobacter succinogenes major paralogous domain-containing protein [Bacteroidales bacterium]